VDTPQVTLLKRDALGSVELIELDGARFVRRVASGGRIPGSRGVARILMGRERRALATLGELAGPPSAAADSLPARTLQSALTAAGRAPDPRDVLVRPFIEGLALHHATTLPEDFFDHLDRLVLEFHRRGVCHNDLHKEQNVIVRSDGFPALIDFQLASVHANRDSRAFRVRCREDLRHVQKHRRRYTRDGRGPSSAAAPLGAAYGASRSPLAAAWRRLGKPLYTALTRGLLRTRDGEERRPSSGPWPEWVGPLSPPQEAPGGAGPGRPDGTNPDSVASASPGV
jgi:hypothetical protein